MAIRCSYCGRDYDVSLFEFGRTMPCDCGKTVTLTHEQMKDELLYAQRSEDRKIREIRTMADGIASLIIASDYSMTDIEIEKEKLRQRISELFPDKAALYDLIYEPRFRRLKEQFRQPNK